jgi:hypothetical protein
MTIELDQNFRCERYVDRFPSGMPYKACLRRQLERQGSLRPGKEGPPRNEFCALSCQTGRRIHSEFVHLGLAYCPRCGGALIGSAECGTCAERALEENRGPAKGFLPTAKATASERIWDGRAPNAPLGPPPGAPKPPPAVGLAPVEERAAPVRTACIGGIVLREDELEPETSPAPPAAEPLPPPPAPTAPVNTQPPATVPAEEDPMPKGKRTTPAPCCGTMSTARHKMGCTGKAKAEKLPDKIQYLPDRAAARPVVRKLAPVVGYPKVHDLEVKPEDLAVQTIEQLVADRSVCQKLIDQIEAELRRRQDELAKALQVNRAAAV